MAVTGVTRKKAAAATGTAKPKGDWRPVFLASLAQMCNVSEACREAKISRVQAYRVRGEDAEFAAAWDDAIDEGIEALELAARKRAMTVSDTLAIFLLKSHRPDVYRDRQSVEHTGKGGGPVAIDLDAWRRDLGLSGGGDGSDR